MNKEAAWDPRDEYGRRLAARQSTLDGLEKRDALYSNLRFWTFVAGLIAVAATVAGPQLHPVFVAIPAVAFVILVVRHEGIVRGVARARGAVRFYESGFERLDFRWAGKGLRGDDLAPPDHLYAEDLDLFGEASLFELLCTARTRAGEETLGRWLCAPAEIAEIESRQGSVEDLRQRLDLREDLALLGGELRASIRPAHLTRWAEASAVLQPGPRLWISMALTAGMVAALCVWYFSPLGLIAVMAVLLVEMFFMRWVKDDVAKIVSLVDSRVKELGVLAELSARLERETFSAEKLQGLQRSLCGQARSASAQIARLQRIMWWLELSRNQFFAPFAFIVLWPVHCAYALERWRARNGAAVREWLGAIGEFEALSSFAGYAYEHPADPFPELVHEGARFEGEELGHPLLEENVCVRNSVRLGESPALLIVSGSNMSGKSTLLRTVGINAVLALAGAPVRGTSLRLSRFGLGASLHIVDSIQSGTSHFYAEILRLRRVLELVEGGEPVLFMIDEILHGTNSHDRRIGSEAVLKGLVERGALGLVTTHDLALTELAQALGDRARNVHFVDHLEGDRLVFDYRMQDGVVQKSNALALMRATGLEV